MSLCPFGPCSATPLPVIEQATPGDDELTAQRVPVHPLEGRFARFGTCPASLMLLPLSEYDRGHLLTMAATLRRIDRDHQRDAPPPAWDAATRDGERRRHEHPKTPHPTEGGWFSPAFMETPRRRPELRILGPRSDESANPPNITSGESTMSDNMRDDFRARTQLAIEGFEQGQEVCASLTDQGEALDTLIAALRNKQEAAHALALSAIGGSDIPEAAANMVGSSAAAGSTIEDITAALALLLVRVGAVHASLGAAAESGREYLGRV